MGAPGWTLDRPGFAWGGLSVAACWYGGTVGVARRLLAAAASPRRADDTLLLMHLGIVDARLAEARTALADAARRIDAGAADGEAGVLLAQRVRATVATAAEVTLRQVGHALGPAPLAHDAVHGKRVADLELYIRQHHAERDDVTLGRLVREFLGRLVIRPGASGVARTWPGAERRDRQAVGPGSRLGRQSGPSCSRRSCRLRTCPS